VEAVGVEPKVHLENSNGINRLLGVNFRLAPGWHQIRY